MHADDKTRNASEPGLVMGRIERLWRSDLRAADVLRAHGFEMDRGAAWPVALAVACLTHQKLQDLKIGRDTALNHGASLDPAPDIAEIANATALPRTTVRRAIDRLLDRGLVTLDQSAADGRQRLVYATPKFEDLMARVSHAVDRCYQGAFMELAPAPHAKTAPNWARALVERMRDAVLITDVPPPGGAPLVLAANSAFERLSGYAPEEIIGRNPKMLQGPDTDTKVRAALREAIDRRQPATGRFLNYRKDGSSYLCELTLEPLSSVHGAAGTPKRTDAFLGIAREIA